MKTLFLVRHAKSDWDHPELSDKERPLAKRGLRDAPFMAQLVKAKGFAPDRLVSSTARRALSTASFFAVAYQLPASQVQLRDELYEASPYDVIKVIQSLDDADQTVFVFGHNPTFTAVANMFEGPYIDNVPTAGVVGIGAEVDSWRDFDRRNARRFAFWFPKEHFD